MGPLRSGRALNAAPHFNELLLTMMPRRSTGFACAALAILCVGMAWLMGGSLAFFNPLSFALVVLAFILGIYAVIALRP